MKSFLFLMVAAIVLAFVAVIAPKNAAELPLDILGALTVFVSMCVAFPKFGRAIANFFVQVSQAIQFAFWSLTDTIKLGANAFFNEGTHEGGQITKLTDGAYSSRFLLVEIGTDIGHVSPCNGAADIPLGVMIDESTAAEQEVTVMLLSSALPGTLLVTSSAAITAGDMLVTDTAGKARTLPATTGTYYIIGRALQAATAADQQIEFAPCFPIQRVVP